MSVSAQEVKTESRALLSLAGPILVNTVGMVLLVTVDMVMVGRLGAKALGAVAIANAVSTLIIVFGTMSLMPTTAVVARASGAKDEGEIEKSFAHGLLTALVLAVPMAALLLAADWIIPALIHLNFIHSAALDPETIAEASTYTRILAAGVPFGMAYTACASLMRGLGRVKPIMYIVFVANVVNALGDWALIFGKWGAPQLGVPGCAWSTSLTRVAMLTSVLIYIATHREIRKYLRVRALLRPELQRVRKLLGMGVPLGLRELFDRGVFTAATFLVAQLGAAELALNQIALNLSNTLVMGVMAVAIAGSVRVGKAMGAKQADQARLTVGTVFAWGGGIAALLTAAVWLAPEAVLRMYSDDPTLTAHGAQVVRMGAAFFFVDALASVVLNALIAMLDTKRPSLVGVLLYWLVALPLGCALTFRLGFGVAGMWLAFCVGDVIFLGYLLRRCLKQLPAPALAAAVPAVALKPGS